MVCDTEVLRAEGKPVYLCPTLGLPRTVIRCERQGVIRHNDNCATSSPLIHHFKRHYYFFFLFVFFTFLCNNEEGQLLFQLHLETSGSELGNGFTTRPFCNATQTRYWKIIRFRRATKHSRYKAQCASTATSHWISTCGRAAVSKLNANTVAACCSSMILPRVAVVWRLLLVDIVTT